MAKSNEQIIKEIEKEYSEELYFMDKIKVLNMLFAACEKSREEGKKDMIELQDSLSKDIVDNGKDA